MKCCICGERAEGIVVYGEFVCTRCHYEATGERPPKLREVKKKRTLPKRRQIRDELITDNLINRISERLNQ